MMQGETKVEQKYAVQMKNITKTFGHAIANDNVSIDLEYGEILSLLGENGSGKTTLMNMLSGIYFPDSGKILIDGKEAQFVRHMMPMELGVGNGSSTNLKC